MLIGAAVCPHPPLLVPEVAGGAASELDDLRAACDEAVRRLVPAEGVDLLVVVGGDAETRGYDADEAGGLRRYGVDVQVGAGPPMLPLSLTIGRWLLTRAGLVPPHGAERESGGTRVKQAAGAVAAPGDGSRPEGDVAGPAQAMAGVGVLRFQGVSEAASPAECVGLGHTIAASAERVALLVMGDGSACRTEKAPGYLDERAEIFDTELARALADGAAATLTRLDPGLSRELRAAGRAAWQVLGGAAGDDRFTSELLAAEAPYGVGYLVASWHGRQAGRSPG